MKIISPPKTPHSIQQGTACGFALLFLLLSLPTLAATYPITTPPPNKYPSFYKKITYAGPFPILSSEKTSDYALKEAAYLINTMLAKRPDILQTLAASNSRLAIMAHNEYTNDIPEHKASLANSKNSPDWWDRRARGLGGSKTLPVASCGEENLLAFPGDPYHAENIFIHEFAHMIHLRAVNILDPTFNTRLKKAFESAKAAGLWKDKYAGTYHTEYFAEGVQSWFDDNRPPDHDHNHVNTRAELIAYDPALADLCREVFRDTKLTYFKPTLRKSQAHLTGYNYANSPTFTWPARLKQINVKPDRAKKQTATTPPKKQPNILFLMADDWSYPHAGALGDTTVQTPTFDRVAREGVLYPNAFVSAPSCTPSRLATASGQYHWRLNTGVNLGGSLDEGVPVYPELLQAAGYRIGFSRKGATPSKYTFTNRDPFGPRFKNFNEFIDAQPKNKPFCYWYGAGEPHRPYNWQAGQASGINLAKINLPAPLPDSQITRHDMADYYLKVQRYDSDSAAMLAKLESLNLLQNTIVIMAGDNGLPFPRCKATLYDLGTRVPLAIRWPQKFPPNRTLTDFVTLTDLAPTILEAAGLKPPQTMSGRSLLPQLTSNKSGQVDPTRTHVITGMERHVYPYPSRAIRTAAYLYIRNYKPQDWPTGLAPDPQPHHDFVKTPWPTIPGSFSFNCDPSPSKQYMLENAHLSSVKKLAALAFGPRPTEELYQLKSDPNQFINLATNPAFAKIKQQLSNQLSSELNDSKDPRHTN